MQMRFGSSKQRRASASDSSPDLHLDLGRRRRRCGKVQGRSAHTRDVARVGIAGPGLIVEHVVAGVARRVVNVDLRPPPALQESSPAPRDGRDLRPERCPCHRRRGVWRFSRAARYRSRARAHLSETNIHLAEASSKDYDGRAGVVRWMCVRRSFSAAPDSSPASSVSTLGARTLDRRSRPPGPPKRRSRGRTRCIGVDEVRHRGEIRHCPAE